MIDIDARDAEAVIRAGAPPLFFASSELASSFPGYIEGAIVAGKEIAAKDDRGQRRMVTGRRGHQDGMRFS